MSAARLIVRRLGQRPYAATWQAMREFTDARDRACPDELWLLEHPPVYTQGLAGRPEHVLDPGATPVIRTDRGGQVTWHGPGQLVAYPLLDLTRLGIGIRRLVDILEQVVIDLLAGLGVAAARRDGAPGVYVDGAKIASLGLKVRRGCTYHGIAFNLDNSLEPFARINPCGHAGQPVTRLADHVDRIDGTTLGDDLGVRLAARLGLDVEAAGTDDAAMPDSNTRRHERT